MTTTASLAYIIEVLEALFVAFNTHFFSGQLEKPVITASPKGRKNALGWCSCQKIWKEKGKEEYYYEINLCAEYLCRPFEDVCKTLLHELIHLYNLQLGIRDCSRNGVYHNKHFKIAAEANGLTCERHKTCGWAITALTRETAEWLKETYGSNPGTFSIFRNSGGRLDEPDAENSDSSTSNSRRYVCPSCGTIVRATKVVNIICGDCREAFQQRER